MEELINTIEERVHLLLENIALQGYEVNNESTFLDMGLDSLDKIDFNMDLEDEFDLNIPDEILGMLDTVEEIVEYIRRRVCN